MQAIRPGPLQPPEDCLSPDGSLPGSSAATTPAPSSATGSGRNSTNVSHSGTVASLGTEDSSTSAGGVGGYRISSSSHTSSLNLPPAAPAAAGQQGPGTAGSFSGSSTAGSFTSTCPPAYQPGSSAPGSGPDYPSPVAATAATAAQGTNNGASTAAAAAAAAGAPGEGAGAGGMHQLGAVPRQASFSSMSSPTGVGLGPGGAFSMGPDQQGSVPLVQQLGVSVMSLARLFRADADTEFEQPVWMVINLQGKIKGSYTADKMVEFCRRGTLGGAQLVLGLDRNLPYNARQELSYYRPLSHLVIAVHHGARYCPLTEASVCQLARQGLAAAQWEPLVSPATESTASPGATSAAAAAGDLAAELQQGLDLGETSGDRAQGAAAMAAGSSRVAAMAAAARLRSVLQRLCCGSGSRMQGGGRPMGRRQTPLWLYINHLGWCRGPFSGGKVIQAHMCGRLPHDTLVVGLEPDVPPALISTDVEFWFRPMKDLIDQVAAGYSYNPVSWQDVAAYSLHQQTGQGAGTLWQPLVYRDTGNPPPFQGGPQPSISHLHNPAAAAGAGANFAGGGGGSSSNLVAHLMQGAQQQQQQQQRSPDAAAAAAAAVSAAMHAAVSAANSPGVSRAGSLASPTGLPGDQTAVAAAAAASSMLMGMSAGMPAGATGGYGDAAGVLAASNPASQALLMQQLLQPQQWMQPDASTAAAQMQGQYAMQGQYTYPMYLMPQHAGFAVQPGMHMAMPTPAASMPGVWDPAQLQAQQAAMLQGAMVTPMAMPGMQLPADGSAAAAAAAAVAGMYSHQAGFVTPQGFVAQGQQQFWGQQPGAQGWTGGVAGTAVAGSSDYSIMQQQQQQQHVAAAAAAAGGGGGAPGQQQGALLPGVMATLPFLPGSQQM